MLKGTDQLRSGATLDRIDAVARVFGLRSWHMVMPALPDDLDQANMMSDVVDCYISADDDGRDLIRRVAEREGRYKHPANK